MYDKILVINLMHIGDLLLTTPVFRTLRTNFPDSHIALLADKKLADLVKLNENLDECLFIDKKGDDNNIPNFVHFIKKVRDRHFDLVINLHRNERASTLAAFSGGKKIVGYAKPGFSLFFNKVLPNLNQTEHQVDSHFDVLREALGIDKIDDRGLEMWIDDEAKFTAEKIFAANYPAGTKVVAFNIGASWMTKRWIDSYFAECADILIKRGIGVAFLGGEMDKGIVAACVEQMRHKDNPLLKVFTGDFSLAELAGFLDNCAVMLTTDSGPMHVGVARNIPVVCMFGASPVLGFSPYDSKDIAIQSPVSCHPCGKHICPNSGEENFACMKKIPVDVVMKCVDELLETYGQPAKNLPRPTNYKCRVVEL